MATVTVARALTAHVARRALLLATLLATGTFLAVVVLCGVLVYFFSPWWWLLLVPFTVLLMLFVVIRCIVAVLIGRVYGVRLTKAQKDGLDNFVDKVQGLLEARATPPPLFVAITLKDLVIHREITTIKRLIADTTGLKHEYASLEKLFD